MARSKSIKFKKHPVPDDVKVLVRFANEPCKAEFIIWAEGTWLDITGIWDGDPVFRPAICAWEAWKAAWALKDAK